MDNSDVLQRNAAGELEVRVVNGTEKADAPANYDDVFTVNTEGKRALRVVGAGGGGGGTGTVTSVNGVQPVDGNVEITGNNITATVGEEEATITQHLTTLKNDDAELGEQVQGLQQSVNGKQDALTAEQLAAANSGITSAKVASYDAYAGEISAKVNIAQGEENAGKVMTVGADGNLAPAVLSAWPSDSDYLPVSVTLNEHEDMEYHLSCNLGALEDGVYEFYYRFIEIMKTPALPDPTSFGWQQWLVHLTVKDGEVFGLNSGANNNSYCMPLPDADNVGSANQPYGASSNAQLFCGKSGSNFYVEGNSGNAGSIYLINDEDEPVAFTAAYVTKIKNINTGEFVSFANVALVEYTVANIVNENISVVNPYGADVTNTIKRYFTTSSSSWSSLDAKYFSVDLGNTLTNRPLASNISVETNSFPKKATICFYTIPQSADYLEFDVYGSPTQVKITNVRKGGIFSDVVFANYYDTNSKYSGCLYLSKADGTNFQNTTEITACASWYGQSFTPIRIGLARSEIPSSYTFIENLTPEDGVVITTDATLTGAGTPDSPLGIAATVPAQTGTFVLKCIDGTLTWVAETTEA